MAAGPPGARWRIEIPASDTRPSTTSAWSTRRATYWRMGDGLRLPPPLVHVPAVGEGVAVGSVVEDPLLHALDAHVAEDGQIGEVGADHLLELLVDRPAPGPIHLAHAVLEQLVHRRVLVLAHVAPRARLGGDVL